MSENVDRVVGDIYRLTPKELRELRNRLSGLEDEPIAVPAPGREPPLDSRGAIINMEKK